VVDVMNGGRPGGVLYFLLTFFMIEFDTIIWSGRPPHVVDKNASMSFKCSSYHNLVGGETGQYLLMGRLVIHGRYSILGRSSLKSLKSRTI